MINESRRKRMNMAIAYLQKQQLMGYGDIVKEIHERTNRDVSNIRSALRGDDKYLNPRFVKVFCSAFGGKIPPEWILDGVEPEIEEAPQFMKPEMGMSMDSKEEDPLMELSKEQLAKVVRSLIQVPPTRSRNLQRLLLKQAVEELLKNAPVAEAGAEDETDDEA